MADEAESRSWPIGDSGHIEGGWLFAKQSTSGAREGQQLQMELFKAQPLEANSSPPTLNPVSRLQCD